MYFEVQLDQEQPMPIVASGWSRAENVAGASGRGYSLWVDITFVDGSHSWGNAVAFDAGTHDWQRRTLPIVPTKPIASLRIFGLFRNTTGTVWFDDYSLTTLDLADDVVTFNGVPVLSARPRVAATDAVSLRAGELSLVIDRGTGAFVGEGGVASGIFLRDAAAGSDFRQPRGPIEVAGEAVLLHGEDDELQLAVDARVVSRGDHIDVSGTVRDLTGEDRAVSVYLALPVDATDGQWHDDMTVTREIDAPLTYLNAVRVEAGPNGHASRYPLGCVTTGDSGVALGVPMDQPRIAEIAYDAASSELYCAWHLGLAEETGSEAGFSASIYPVDPQWGFRDALRRYYTIYPHCFTKRNRREGIWMPFTDISTVEGWEDFGFAFHEGDNNVAFDDRADIASFVYCEPVSYWMRMAPEEPRTYENAVRLLQAAAQAGDAQARAAVNSVVTDSEGTLVVQTLDRPWCDGALFTLNPSPNLYADDERLSQGEHVSAAMWRAFDRGAQTVGWRGYAGGFAVAREAGRGGSSAIRVAADSPGRYGASQHVELNQQQARDLVVSGWGRLEDLSAPGAAQWQLYVDITYADGSNLWGQTAPFDPTVDGWQQARRVIEVEKPVAGATIYAMLRGETTGSVLFDELFLGEAGGENLLTNPGFEPTGAADLDGVYIDSGEMAASQANYRREHWRYAQTPLTFDSSGRVCQLTIFNATEFARAMAEPLHERGELLFANSTPSRFPWLAAWLDVMGTETNWSPGETYQPMSVPELAYRRAICYQRPYLFLMNTVYDEFRPEWVELYFKRSIAWGHFPSFFSHNAADDPYWQRPNLYNRDRPLFQKYIPVCATLSRAGWEPVTHARATPDHVYVERFGPDEDGAVYLTLFNDSDAPCEADLQIDPAAMPVGHAEEVLADGPQPLQRAALGLWTVRLKAQDLAVLRFTQRP